jgi:hypothetical protein
MRLAACLFAFVSLDLLQVVKDQHDVPIPLGTNGSARFLEYQVDLLKERTFDRHESIADLLSNALILLEQGDARFGIPKWDIHRAELRLSSEKPDELVYLAPKVAVLEFDFSALFDCRCKLGHDREKHIVRRDVVVIDILLRVHQNDQVLRVSLAQLALQVNEFRRLAAAHMSR